VPVAENSCELPSKIVALPGCNAIDTRVAFVTVTVVLPVTEPNVAEIEVWPGEIAVRTPEVAPMVAIALLLDDHCTELVRICVLPSKKNPVAVNWAAVLFATLALPGVTERDASPEAVINRLVLPLTEPNLAMILTFPGLWPVAEPEAEMVATLLFELDQVTCELRF